jgi:hypothetical protein
MPLAPARVTLGADGEAAAVVSAVRAARPDVIVHMLTAVPDPVEPRRLARDMAMTNRLRTEGTASLLAAGPVRPIGGRRQGAGTPGRLGRWAGAAAGPPLRPVR